MGAGARSIDPGPDPGNGVPDPETVDAVVEVEVEVAEDGSVTGGGQETGRDLDDSEPSPFYRVSARQCCSWLTSQFIMGFFFLKTDPTMFAYLRSLQAFSNPSAGISVDVKVFIVPVGNHSNIPFSRVNHSKFMVTDKTAYVGTSNWSEDYFSHTAGVGLIVSQKTPRAQPGATTVQEQLRQLFERDWSSHYAMDLDRQVPSQDCVW